MRRGFCAAALAALFGAGSALAQYDLPISRPASRPIDDPKPVYKYELKPEHGEFLVCVKSFAGDFAGSSGRARELAEGLVEYIRSECRLYAFVHERGWALRQERSKNKEMLIAAIRKQYAASETEEQINARIKKQVKMERIPDEYVVCVAPGKKPLKTMDEAIEFAKYVHKLPAPPREFCDAVVIGGSIQDVSRTHGEPKNPFPTAMPGRNLTVPRKEMAAERPKADDFLLSLNAGKEFSLIHETKKPVTLVVQTYGSKFLGRVLKPGELVPAAGKSDGEMLERAAQNAHSMAKALRSMNPPLKAYVLHTRYESFVCIGEYDSEKDAELLSNQKLLASKPILDGKTGKVLETLMDKPMPALIPRP
jgi:hypothetical protein